MADRQQFTFNLKSRLTVIGWSRHTYVFNGGRYFRPADPDVTLQLLDSRSSPALMVNLTLRGEEARELAAALVAAIDAAEAAPATSATDGGRALDPTEAPPTGTSAPPADAGAAKPKDWDF